MACGGIEPPYTDFQSVANPSQLTSHVVQFPFFLAPHYTKCKVLLVSGYRHLLNDNRSIQLPVLSLTGILISTCISVINTLGVYWQHHLWGLQESNPRQPGHTAFLYAPINHRLFSESAGNPLHALPRMYVVFAVLRLYVSALFPDFQPKHRPSADRQRNLTEAQCVGFEPARRINARRLSKPFQYHYGNTAKFSTYRQRTFIVLFPRFLSRQRFHHKKNIIHYTKTLQPCHINNILQRVGIAGIEPATTRI